VSRFSHRVPAAVVLAVAVVMVSACGIPTDATPTVIAKADVPSRLLNPVTPTTVPSTAPPTVAVPETIYLVAPSQTVIGVTRDVQVPANLDDILEALLEGPTIAESKFGLETFLTPKIRVTATVVGGVATIDFTSNPVQVVGPEQTLAIAQVVYTATEQGTGVTGVVFQIAGQTIGVPTASGAQVSGPVNRTSYLPQAPSA
jgi:spore germination protein GerM